MGVRLWLEELEGVGLSKLERTTNPKKTKPLTQRKQFPS